MTSRIEFPKLTRSRAVSDKYKKPRAPDSAGNSDKTLIKPAAAKTAVAPGALTLTLLKPEYSNISKDELQQLNALIKKGEVYNRLKEDDRHSIWHTQKLHDDGIPVQFAKDINRSELSITYDNRMYSIRSVQKFKQLPGTLPPDKRAVLHIISAICNQSFFADNLIALAEQLPKSFSCSNNEQYKISVIIKDCNDAYKTFQQVTMRGEVDYGIAIVTEQGDPEKIEGLKVTGIVEKVFNYDCLPSEIQDKDGILQRPFTLDFISEKAKNVLKFEQIKRERSQTQPAIPSKVKPWINDLTRSKEYDLPESLKSVSLSSDSETDKENDTDSVSLLNTEKVRSSSQLKNKKNNISQPSLLNSHQKSKPSFFARLQLAWSDMTNSIYSYWQRLKRFFSF